MLGIIVGAKHPYVVLLKNVSLLITQSILIFNFGKDSLYKLLGQKNMFSGPVLVWVLYPHSQEMELPDWKM